MRGKISDEGLAFDVLAAVYRGTSTQRPYLGCVIGLGARDNLRLNRNCLSTRRRGCLGIKQD